MAEIVNLRMARKARARAQAAAHADANRAAHGRTRAEKDAAGRERDAIERALDGARLDPER